MALHVNTFKGGLDLDTNVNAYGNTNYPYALNLRIISDGENSSGTLTSMEDSEVIFNIPSGWTVVGLSKMRGNLVMFTKNGNNGKIYYIPFTSLSTGINIEDYLKVNKAFNFGNNVQIVARYETSDIQKVYWTDGTNVIRFANLALNSSIFNSMDIDEFNIVQEAVLSTPVLSSMITGSLKVGVVQYAYCLYNIGGAETGYSSASKPIPISISSLTDNTSLLFRGSNIGEISNKGVIISISNIDTDFDRIRVVRLFYAEQNGTPEIDVIYEGSLASTMSITDTGGVTLGTLTIDGYRYIPNIFSATTLETKNDYLFAGNIIEKSFEINFDARAYRFNSLLQNKLYDSSYTSIQWDVASYGYDVPETLDCANPYNFINRDATRPAYDNCKYKSDGVTLGGTGKYISFGFTTNTRVADSAYLQNQALRVYTTNSGSGYQDLSNPVILHNNTGYQRDEIYRFAFVGYDVYGRQSYAKWICDIRFPSEEDGIQYSITDGENTIKDLGIIFTINADGKLLLESQGVVSWQIVRAERTYDDATVKDCGYISSLYNNSDGRMRWRDLPQISSTNNNTPLALEYITPETNYNKNNYNPYNRLDIYSGYILNGLTSKNSDSEGATSITFKLSGTPAGVTPTYKTISKSMLFQHFNNETFISMQSVGYAKQLSNRFGPMYSRDNDNKDPRQYNRCTKGTTLVLRIDDSAPSNGVKYVRRRNYSIPYGGYSYASINSTIYYACGAVLPINTTSSTVYGGDCFIGWFEYLRGVWSNDTAIIISSGDRRSKNCSNQIAYLLVESKINLKYTTNPSWSYYDDGIIADYFSGGSSTLATIGYEYNAMRETRGVYSLLWDNTNYFTQDFDLYTYNTVYSQMDKSKVFISEPLDATFNNTIDTRIYRTSKKINGENSDNWTKFPVNNLLDVDTKYGKLTKLLTFDNKLFFVQDEAIGLISVAEREVITSNTGNATIIGTGGVMERYDYIATGTGCYDIEGIIPSTKTIYYIDRKNKKLCRVGQTIEFLSDLKGLKKFMDTATYTTLGSSYSPNFNEIWFKLTNDVVIFNEYTNTFVTFTDENFLRSIYDSEQVFNVSTAGTFKKLDIINTYKDVELSVLINPTNQFTSRFDSITLSTLVDRNSTIQDRSFSRISITNNYQFLTNSTFYPPARKRMRQFIYNGIRNAFDNTRFIDSYMKVNLYFTKTYTNDRLKVFDMVTNYTPINVR